MKFYSPDNKSHDTTYECGKNNHINESHVWIVDTNDIEEVEKMKEIVNQM